MRKIRQGFTIIEVSIFLAITGLIFVGVTVGVQNSMYWQRYNDATQSFAEFMRSVYSQVQNVQSYRTTGGGMSSEALYGKLVVFGEDKSDGKIHVYTLVGDAESNGSDGGTIELLDNLKTTVASGGSLRAASDSFIPKWGSKIKIKLSGSGAELDSGMLLIARHPNSGLIHTYFTKTLVDKMTISKLGDLAFDNTKDIDFCINVNGDVKSGTRADVRLNADARNASSIEVIATDDGGEYKCGW